MAAGALLIRRGLLTVSLIAVAGLAAGCSYGPEVRGPFHGQVIDTETGQPLKGAVVVASWHYGNPFIRFDVSVYDAQEAVTDANGRLELPGLRGWIGWPNVQRPVFYLFSPGYGIAGTRITPANGREHLDPTIHHMRKLETREEICDWLRLRLPLLVPPDKMPQYIAAVSDEMDRAKCGAADPEAEKQS